MEMQPISLYYEEHGQGTPVIFLHGFPFDHTIWEPLVPLLENHARLIMPDLRGFGRSPVTDGAYPMRLLAEDVHRLLDVLKVEKVILVGHSMGGYVSLAFAHAYPGHLLGLGLITTQAAADNPERRQTRYKTAEAVQRKGARVVASDMVDRLTPRAELAAPIKQLILQAHPTGIVGALKGMADRPDMTGMLSDIHVPAVVIAGAADQLMNAEKVHTMAQMLPKGWLVEIPGGGHMPMLEDPQATAGALLEVINKVKGA